MSVALCQFCWVLAASNAAAQPINRGVLLLAVLILLLGAFFVGVLLLNISRRNRRKAEEARRAAEREAKGKDRADPWYEAGRRASAEDAGEPGGKGS